VGQRGARAKGIGAAQGICPWHLDAWGPVEGRWGAGPKARGRRLPPTWGAAASPQVVLPMSITDQYTIGAEMYCCGLYP